MKRDLTNISEQTKNENTIKIRKETMNRSLKQPTTQEPKDINSRFEAVLTDLNCDPTKTPGLSICAVNLENMKPSTLTAVAGGWLVEETGERLERVHMGELIDDSTGNWFADTFVKATL